MVGSGKQLKELGFNVLAPRNQRALTKVKADALSVTFTQIFLV
jgi:hypothetical protein